MGNKSITGVSSLSFNGAAANLHGIEVGNLLDKSATEEVTGESTHSGKNTFTGIINVGSASRLQIAGVALDASLTSNDLNMMKDLYSTSLVGQRVLTTGRSLGAVPKAIDADTTLVLGDAGLIIVNTGSANITVKLPDMKSYAAGSQFIIHKPSENYTLIINKGDHNAGFIMKTGLDSEITGSVITLDSVYSDPSSFKFVILYCTGVEDSTARWAIIGGSDAVLS